jgi:hypothetical protein
VIQLIVRWRQVVGGRSTTAVHDFSRFFEPGRSKSTGIMESPTGLLRRIPSSQAMFSQSWRLRGQAGRRCWPCAHGGPRAARSARISRSYLAIAARIRLRRSIAETILPYCFTGTEGGCTTRCKGYRSRAALRVQTVVPARPGQSARDRRSAGKGGGGAHEDGSLRYGDGHARLLNDEIIGCHGSFTENDMYRKESSIQC